MVDNASVIYPPVFQSSLQLFSRSFGKFYTDCGTCLLAKACELTNKQSSSV